MIIRYLPTSPQATMLTFGPDATINQSAKTIAWTVPYGTDVTSLSPTYTVSSGATCDKASGSTHNFINPVTYSVFSSDNAITNVYTVTVNLYVPAPFVDITSIEGTTNVDPSTTSIDIFGTNNEYTIAMRWTNSLGGGDVLPVGTPDWAFTAPLMSGANIITVYGSNPTGVVASASVMVNTIDPTAPFVAITNIDVVTNVLIGTTEFSVAGTNNTMTVGGMWWDNSLGGGDVMAAGTPDWTFTATMLSPGANIITVYGSNTAGIVASASATVDVVPEPAAAVATAALWCCLRVARKRCWKEK